MDDIPNPEREVNPFALGAAYLDYCVKQGWLNRTGDGPTAQYELTELGQKKLADVPFNFDLSKLAKKGGSQRKKRHHLKK